MMFLCFCFYLPHLIQRAPFSAACLFASLEVCSSCWGFPHVSFGPPTEETLFSRLKSLPLQQQTARSLECHTHSSLETRGSFSFFHLGQDLVFSPENPPHQPKTTGNTSSATFETPKKTAKTALRTTNNQSTRNFFSQRTWANSKDAKHKSNPGIANFPVHNPPPSLQSPKPSDWSPHRYFDPWSEDNDPF